MEIEPLPDDWTLCQCGEYTIAPNSTLEIRGKKHRHFPDDCYLCDEYGNPINEKRTQMEFKTFVRKPFVVEAVEITTENIGEVAKYVGDLREKEDGTPYILVDRRLVPNVFRVYPGFYMTKMGENVRCYSKKIFREQFIEQSDEIKPWVDFMTGQDDSAA